jgi:hypothetical protein
MSEAPKDGEKQDQPVVADAEAPGKGDVLALGIGCLVAVLLLIAIAYAGLVRD